MTGRQVIVTFGLPLTAIDRRVGYDGDYGPHPIAHSSVVCEGRHRSQCIGTISSQVFLSSSMSNHSVYIVQPLLRFQSNSLCTVTL